MGSVADDKLVVMQNLQAMFDIVKPQIEDVDQLLICSLNFKLATAIINEIDDAKFAEIKRNHTQNVIKVALGIAVNEEEIAPPNVSEDDLMQIALSANEHHLNNLNAASQKVPRLTDEQKAIIVKNYMTCNTKQLMELSGASRKQVYRAISLTRTKLLKEIEVAEETGDVELIRKNRELIRRFLTKKKDALLQE